MDPNILQEGIILEGTPAAEGVSASDMEKRQRYISSGILFTLFFLFFLY